jgi:hypothetical protein
MDGMTVGADTGMGGANHNTWTYVYHCFKRAPGVFDVVCYTGTGSATTITHSLGVVPELVITKCRSNATANGWLVWNSSFTGAKYNLLNTTMGNSSVLNAWNNATPTTTAFPVGTTTDNNGNGYTYVAYLFATLAGVSKVGSYTGGPNTTNLVSDSESFETSSWVGGSTGITVSANSAIAPDGSLTADKFVENTTANQQHYRLQNINVTAGSTITASCYVKKGERDWFMLQGYGGPGSYPQCSFDLTNGAIGTSANGASSPTMTPAGNGWYRCSITYTMASGTLTTVYLIPVLNDTTSYYAGNVTSGLYVWGCQVEYGSTVSAYASNININSKLINCGFTTGARFVLIKRTDTVGDWYVWDSTRGIVAANDPHLSLNTTAAEVTTDDSVDPDTRGFIVNQLAATNINVSAATYIFLAFA